MRAKPLWGDPCNRCGLCCMGGQCTAADVLLGPREGPCSALTSDGLGGYVCGLAVAIGATADERDAIMVAIGSGIGCDMTATPQNLGARAMRIRGMVAAARKADRELHPAGRAILARWGLAPP